MKNYKLSLIAARNFLTYCTDRRVYAFLSKPDTWGSPDLYPSWYVESVKNSQADFNETFFAKQLLDSDFSLVVRRVDWVEGVFDQWNSNDPLIASKDFYCVTSTGNVYKCLDNNGGATSTVEPSVVTPSRFTTADGYVWKYLYTVTSEASSKFQTPDWIPVKEIVVSEAGYENQYASQIAATPGTIDRIDIVQAGTKYTQANTTVTIIGDGTGAAATATVHSITGAIISVDITNVGSGYTYAEAYIEDASAIPGTGAIVTCSISPQFGHGYNPADELFSTDILANVSVTGNEAGFILGDVTYRKLILEVDPKLANDSFATAARYDNTTILDLTGVSGTFVVGEEVTNIAGARAFVVYIDGSSVHVCSVVGTLSGVITGTTSAATGTISTTTSRPLKYSGTPIFRSYFNPRTKALADNITALPLFKF